MASRYDSRTTTFSPDGRLHQVEYAMKAIQKAGSCVAIRATDGIVLAAEKKVVSKLLAPSKTSEKMYKIDEHLCVAVAGLSSDANILIHNARYAAQVRYDEYHVVFLFCHEIIYVSLILYLTILLLLLLLYFPSSSIFLVRTFVF